MTEIFITQEFERRYQELPLFIQKKAEQKEKAFRNNLFHPSLHTEKLRPKEKEYWSFRIDLSYRILFRFRDDKSVFFITCGHHNWIYQYIISH